MGMGALLPRILLLYWPWTQKCKASSHMATSLTVAGICTHQSPVLLGLFSVTTLGLCTTLCSPYLGKSLQVSTGTWSSREGALSFLISVSVCKTPTHVQKAGWPPSEETSPKKNTDCHVYVARGGVRGASHLISLQHHPLKKAISTVREPDLTFRNRSQAAMNKFICFLFFFLHLE